MKLIKQIQRGKSAPPRRVLIYGTHGIGKTTFGAMAERPVFIQTEDGLAGVETDRFPLSSTLRRRPERALGELYTEEHEYRTVVVDSLDWLERLIHAEVCQKRSVESIEDIGYGKGYVFALPLWREVLAGLDALRNERGMEVILVAHAQIEKFANPETETYDRYAPRLQKLASALVQEWCDEVLFATYRVHTRTATEGFDRKRVQAIGDRRAHPPHHRATGARGEEPPRAARRDPTRPPCLRGLRAWREPHRDGRHRELNQQGANATMAFINFNAADVDPNSELRAHPGGQVRRGDRRQHDQAHQERRGRVPGARLRGPRGSLQGPPRLGAPHAQARERHDRAHRARQPVGHLPGGRRHGAERLVGAARPAALDHGRAQEARRQRRDGERREGLRQARGARIDAACGGGRRALEALTRTFMLPYPPSVNHYWRHVGGKTLVSREGRRYQQGARSSRARGRSTGTARRPGHALPAGPAGAGTSTTRSRRCSTRWAREARTSTTRRSTTCA
jgi:hypothetical protein